MKWVKVLAPAPVLNTADFQSIFCKAMPLNGDGHLEAYEFVALPGMCFKLLSEMDQNILQISYLEYSSSPLFIDRRFCQFLERPIDPLPATWTAASLLERMEKRIGTPYVWGGNWANGIPQMLELYPPRGKILPRIKELWTFRGLDCSGLLFEASSGTTPRNTSALVHYGQSLENDDLLPMDMIVYPGHVLFVRDQDTIIESKSPMGVRIELLKVRLDEILAERKFVRNWLKETDSANSFTIRRFC